MNPDPPTGPTQAGTKYSAPDSLTLGLESPELSQCTFMKTYQMKVIRKAEMIRRRMFSAYRSGSSWRVVDSL